MTENQTAKYIKFWFCVTFSALSFSWDNWRHFRSGNNISVEVDFVVCFPSEFKHWYVDRERNDKNPTARCEKFWFRASLLINFGRASVVVSVAPIRCLGVGKLLFLRLGLGRQGLGWRGSTLATKITLTDWVWTLTLITSMFKGTSSSTSHPMVKLETVPLWSNLVRLFSFLKECWARIHNSLCSTPRGNEVSCACLKKRNFSS